MLNSDSFALTLSCPNQPGLVSVVSSCLYEASGNITEAQQHDDTITGRFFMRVVFTLQDRARHKALMFANMEKIAKQYQMNWHITDRTRKKRVLIMVSRFDHCLVDLLYRWRIGELIMDIAGIIANHPKELYAHIDMQEVPFYYLPITPETKTTQEEKLQSIIEETQADLVILARYMQVLSSNLSQKLIGHCINIHHSFLPGFKGAKPYHQAFERGVKLIGATAHFVTSDLDEGPIIEQDVTRVTHSDTPADFIRKGRDIERRVLAQAVRDYIQDRIILNGSKTVVFGD
ncbi:formyltetrahydrofolate deformylase [Entomobacter blattae]|uniref:Formyltetrahydrofolate deformylase n=1 Tax=Entomobacter blattae TaxID=2762277 RepID=A0A7H1NSU3_9PROT|nr:formyltetrahydrofolate deformylase [Entomobacter blattae]QNT78853.1 Formyltetrahydrofolate deformylase [Entomobacter blattae]